MVTGNLSRTFRRKISRMSCVPEGLGRKKGAGKMVVQLLLQDVKPAHFRQAVKQQLAWEDGDSESPSKLMAIMDIQLNNFEPAEEILGVRISNAVSDKPKDKRYGQRR